MKNKQGIILVVEYQQKWRGVKKVHLSAKDIGFEIGESYVSINAEILNKKIKEKLDKELHRYEINEEEYEIHIYNQKKNEFQPIDSFDSNKLLKKKILRLEIHSKNESNNQEQILFIQGRYFPIPENNGTIPFSSKFITIQEIQNTQNQGTGHNVWDGAMLLLRYLEKHSQLIKNKTILELGSGCGIIGIACDYLDAFHVIMTDLEYTLPNMRYNIQQNNCRSTTIIKECDWLHPPLISDLCTQTNLDLILVADCFWLQELVIPLTKTIKEYVSETNANVLISYQRRGKNVHDLFWNELHDLFQSIEYLDHGFLNIPKELFFLLYCKGIKK